MSLQINLSDETLNHLRFHLERYLGATKKLGDKAKRKADIERYQLYLDQTRDLLSIFFAENVEPPPAPKADADFIVTGQGSVFVFDINTDDALAFVHAEVRPDAWQFLGKHRFAVDHRVAPDLCCQLREAGWNVVVR